jgi:hypothetical protein
MEGGVDNRSTTIGGPIAPFPDPVREERDNFCWGDEPSAARQLPGRLFELDDLETVLELASRGRHFGVLGPGRVGRPRAIAPRPRYPWHRARAGLGARSPVEYGFATRDRVAVLFKTRGTALAGAGTAPQQPATRSPARLSGPLRRRAGSEVGQQPLEH